MGMVVVAKPASSMRIISRVSICSKVRGGAKKNVGPISRRSAIDVSRVSQHAMQKPATMPCA